MNKQPEALRLAECLDDLTFTTRGQATDAAAELRRLHAENEQLRAGLGHPPALEQPQVQASAIPAGWKLVPSDATHQWAENLADRGMRISGLASAISDMLAAAPHPPTTEQSSVVHPTQVEQEPVALLADAIRAESTELIHKWRVLELIQDHARQQPKREPQFDAISVEQERLAVQFCAEIAGPRGGKPSPLDPVRLLEMAEALYRAEVNLI